tara:strand:+ start:78819 stop:80327 length:1509 start_codon:yes stop_codon:yes gene_type:complete
MKLAIYIRVSTQKQATKGESPHLQKKEGIERAKQENLKFEVYDDSGVSGTANDIEKRVQMKRLLSDMEAGQISHIWAQSEERISRGNNLVSAYILDKIQEYKVLVLTKGMTYDLTTAQHRFLFASIIGAGGLSAGIGFEKARDNKRERISRGYSAGGNNMAYGYKSESKMLLLDEYESEIIRRIFKDVVNGHSANSVSRALNAEGVKTKRGGQWSNTHIIQILRNEIYIGKRKWNNEIFKISPIITEKLFFKANEQLKHNRRGDKIFIRDAYPYNTLLSCHKCNDRMRGWARSRAKGQMGVYRCGCSSISVVALHKAMELIVSKLYLVEDEYTRLLNKGASIIMSNLGADVLLGQNRIDDSQVNLFKSEIAKLVTKKKRLGQIYYDDLLTEEDYNSKIFELDKQKREYERKIELLTITVKPLKYSLGQISTLTDSERVEVAVNEISKMVWQQNCSVNSRYRTGILKVELKHNKWILSQAVVHIKINYRDATKPTIEYVGAFK